MSEKKKWWIRFLGKIAVATAVSFTVAVTSLSISGIWYGDSQTINSSMYALEGKGVGYDTIFQWLGASFLISLVSIIIHADYVKGRMLAFWRYVLNILFIVLIVTIFSFLYGWFPLDSAEMWIEFLVCFGICFGACFALSFLLTSIRLKAEKGKYDQLLEEYKKNMDIPLEDEDREEEAWKI